MYHFLFLITIINSYLLVNSENDCYWKDWSRWSECSITCGGGVCYRSLSVCSCSGVSSNMTYCPDKPGQQMLPCNQFLCGTQPPLNKLYWQAHNSQSDGKTWTINEGTQFSCSDNPDSYIQSKTWLEILQDPTYQGCSTWHTLAKEYITAECNINNDMETTEELLEIISQATVLLDTCCEFSTTQQHQAEILREELNRANNGLGSLQSAYYDNGTESDDDFTSSYDGDTTLSSGNVPAPPVSKKMLVIALSVCFGVLAVVVVAVVIWVLVYNKRQSVMVVEDHLLSGEDNRNMEGEGTEMGEED